MCKEVKDGNIHFYMVLAEKVIEVYCNYSQTRLFCKSFLCDSRIPDISISITEKSIAEEKKSFHLVDVPDYVDTNLVSITYNEVLIEQHLLSLRIAESLIKYGIILLHGASIEYEGKGFIFTAKSGTGKTTHIMNWLRLFPDTIVINGDKPYINVLDQTIHSSPWSGKERLFTNRSAPLSGLILLKQGAKNCIKKVEFSEMLPYLLQQCFIPPNRSLALDAIHLIGKLQSIHCFELICNPNVESAYVSYKTLMRDEP